MVPRPPIFRRPKRRKGAEHVVILGETCRITITLDGSEGISLEVMIVVVALEGVDKIDIGGVDYSLVLQKDRERRTKGNRRRTGGIYERFISEYGWEPLGIRMPRLSNPESGRGALRRGLRW